jgi:hypothetical protein
MRKAFCFFLCLYATCLSLAEGVNTADSLSTVFLRLGSALGYKESPISVTLTNVIKTDFGVPFLLGTGFQSSNLYVVLDSATGRPLSIVAPCPYDKTNEPALKTNVVRDVAEKLVSLLGATIDHRMKLTFCAFDRPTGCWHVWWVRCIDGFPVSDETIHIAFGDRDQKVTIFQNLTTDRQCPTTPRVSEKMAAEAAMAYLRGVAARKFGKDYGVTGLEKARLEIVYPQSKSGSPFDERTTPAIVVAPLLVYSFVADVLYLGNSELHRAYGPFHMRVDAITGKPVEGSTGYE